MVSIRELKKLKRPGVGEVQVFALDLGRTDPVQLAADRERLSRDEQARADRFLLEELRRRFTICRSTLRELLGAMTDQTAADVKFDYERSGKPVLRGGRGLHFNVSHSHDHALIALASQPIGVDVEILNTRLRLSTLASQVLSETERVATRQYSPQQLDSLILRLWVCKEAVLKALGIGIQGGMTAVSFEVPVVEQATGWFQPLRLEPALQLELDELGTCDKNTWLDASSWRLHYLPAQAGSQAVVAAPRSTQSLSFMQITWDP